MATDARPRKPALERRAKPAQPPTANCEALMSRNDIAGAMRISLCSFDRMVSAGEYPREDTVIAGMRRWRREHHDVWVRRRCKVDQAKGA